MKRITLVLAVVLGLAVATGAGLWSSHGASAQQPLEDLKCYRIQDFLSKRPLGQVIYISDQFEEKNLIVRNPINFCALADKGGAGGATAEGLQPYDLVCYAIKDAPGQPRFRPTQILTVDQFDENFLQLTKPHSLCEPAEKEVLDVTTAGFDGTALDSFEFKCYRVRRSEHAGRFEKISVRVFDQFAPGGKDVRLGGPVVFCTQVFEKKNKAKNDHVERARYLDPPTEHHASTIGTGTDRSDPDLSCVGPYGHSVWYTYTPGSTDDHLFETYGSTYDTVMAIFKAGDPLEEVACDDDGGSGGSSRISTVLEGGVKYLIMVGSYGSNAGGKLKLNVDQPEECAILACGAAAGATVIDDGVGEAAAPVVQNFVCYSLSQRAPDVILSTTNQLNAHLILLGRGNMFCTPADKCVIRDITGEASVAGCVF